MLPPRAFLISEEDEASASAAEAKDGSAAQRTSSRALQPSSALSSGSRRLLSDVVGSCVVHWFNTTLVEAQVRGCKLRCTCECAWRTYAACRTAWQPRPKALASSGTCDVAFCLVGLLVRAANGCQLHSR